MKKQSQIQRFLQEQGLLHDSPEIIAAAKEKYWAAYHRAWKQRNKKVISVLFSPGDLEVVKDAALSHKLAIGPFVRLACLGYIGLRFVTPDIETVNNIRLLLAQHYFSIQKVARETKNPHQYQALLDRIESVESRVLSQLITPDTLDSFLVDLLQKNPDYKAHLISLLKS